MDGITIEKGRPNEKRSAVEEASYELLDYLGIEYIRADHDAAETIADCLDVQEKLGSHICKNLFLTNRQKTEFYLLLLPGDKAFRTKDITGVLGCSRLSFADADQMEKYLGIRPGSASVLCLMNDRERAVRLVIDREVAENPVLCCHPCKNTSTLKLATRDIMDIFLPYTGHVPTIIDLER